MFAAEPVDDDEALGSFTSTYRREYLTLGAVGSFWGVLGAF